MLELRQQQQHGAAGPHLKSTEHGMHTSAQLALSVMHTTGTNKQSHSWPTTMPRTHVLVDSRPHQGDSKCCPSWFSPCWVQMSAQKHPPSTVFPFSRGPFYHWLWCHFSSKPAMASWFLSRVLCHLPSSLPQPRRVFHSWGIPWSDSIRYSFCLKALDFDGICEFILLCKVASTLELRFTVQAYLRGHTSACHTKHAIFEKKYLKMSTSKIQRWGSGVMRTVVSIKLR